MSKRVIFLEYLKLSPIVKCAPELVAVFRINSILRNTANSIDALANHVS